MELIEAGGWPADYRAERRWAPAGGQQIMGSNDFGCHTLWVVKVRFLTFHFPRTSPPRTSFENSTHYIIVDNR